MAVAARPGSFQYPAVTGSISPSSQEEMDAAVQAPQAQKDAWVAVPIRQRIALLDQLIKDFLAIAERWVAAGVHAKRLDPQSPTAGEEWALGPFPVLRNIRLLRESLPDIATKSRPQNPRPVTTPPDCPAGAQTLPQSADHGHIF